MPSTASCGLSWKTRGHLHGAGVSLLPSSVPTRTGELKPRHEKGVELDRQQTRGVSAEFLSRTKVVFPSFGGGTQRRNSVRCLPEENVHWW